MERELTRCSESFGEGPERDGPVAVALRALRKGASKEDVVRQLTAAISKVDLLPETLALALRDTAREDLSIARLVEGHANALQLARSYGKAAFKCKIEAEAANGTILGVWGADVPSTPVSATGGGRLSGAKRFASGLGVVDLAFVTAGAGSEQQLFVIDASQSQRHDHGSWHMVGMQASQSGTFLCEGLDGEPLGSAGDYTREPHFAGGTWRIAAVSLGGIVGLLDRCSAVLRERGQFAAEGHLYRLTPVTLRAVLAWPAVLRAARIAEGAAGAGSPDRAATISIGTRLLTEELGQDTISAAERSVGLAMFADDNATGRYARDLACYLRQAARDAFMLGAGRAMLGQPNGLAGWLDDPF
ncbi:MULTISPECIES: acyl-CoA dehydrogenase family protein [unclassified Salipiger]|uniref:acyl-CoA dehydrogenase family protein n=1 Tax=unclassified Salipiger TaxID=2640570 RepID=UPI001F1A708A|nr:MULTISPECIES: acyl-CoA dehydrogenase family protein [unclassified Salipiger]